MNLKELEIIVKAARDKEHRHHRFLGLLQNVDIDQGSQEDAEERFRAVERRAAARRAGISEEKIEMDEFGIEIEEE